jgi:pimeloyl-ACP methyl ester carboxylesterase
VADVEGHGPAVVLLHGQPGQAGTWYRVTARLNDRYTTIAPDRPGYGRTGGPAVDFAANAAAVVGLLDRLGLEQATIVAHSWAGAVGLHLAARSPSRVAGLVLVASVAPGEPIGALDRLLAVRAVGELAALATLGVAGRALAHPTLRRAVVRALPSGPGEMVAQAKPSRNAWRSFAAEQRTYVGQIADLDDDLGRIVAPTRIVVGATDRVVAPEAGTLLARRIPGAVLTTLPRAGHLVPWDHPEAIVEAIDDLHRR